MVGRKYYSKLCLFAVFGWGLRQVAGPLKVAKEILAAGEGTEGAEMCVVKTITKPGSRLICFCHSSVQKKSAHNLSYNNNITKVLHTFLWIGGMFTK